MSGPFWHDLGIALGELDKANRRELIGPGVSVFRLLTFLTPREIKWPGVDLREQRVERWGHQHEDKAAREKPMPRDQVLG